MRPLSKSTKVSLELAVSQYALAMWEPRQSPGVQYLLDRGISPASIESFRLGFVAEPISGHEQYRGCVSIPSLGPAGVYGLRFRSLGDGGGPKYLGLSGAPTRLFNIRDIHSAGDDICVTEGEFDAIILTQCGLKAIGVTGANNWKKHHPRMLAGFQRVFIFGDGDKAGTEFSKKVFETTTNGIRISLPQGCDVNDLYLTEGQEGILKLMEDL